MKFSLAGTPGHQIRSYEPGRLQIGERLYTRNVILTANKVDNWDVADVETLQTGDFEALLALRPDVILLGTGEYQIFPPRTLHQHLARAQVGLEVMTTAAAARTFNVLAAEGRHVIAALVV